MTKSFVRLSLALSAATLLFSGPATARDPLVTVIAPTAHTVRVPFSDLNLNDSAARGMLQARVDDASLRVCRATDYEPLLDMSQRSTCIYNARIDARPQVEAAVARASKGQTVALNAAILVSSAL